MIYESYLCHHGIKGQKWGVQHGPPYPLADTTKKVAQDTKTIINSIDRKSKKSNKASSMSDEELQKAVRRMNLENQYNSLTAKETSKGKQYANTALNGVISAATVGASIASIMWAIKELKKE